MCAVVLCTLKYSGLWVGSNTAYSKVNRAEDILYQYLIFLITFNLLDQTWLRRVIVPFVLCTKEQSCMYTELVYSVELFGVLLYSWCTTER